MNCMKNYFLSWKEWHLRLLCLAFFVCSLNAYAASGQIVIKQESSSLKEIIRELEQTSGYTFFYKANDLEDARRMDVNYSGTLQEVLNKVLAGTNLTYVIKNKEVILKPNVKEAGPQQDKNQKRTITGKITDASNDEPIIGANIWIKETTQGSTSDMDGNFSLNVTGNVGVIVVSYIGYKQQEFVVGDKKVINVKLSPDSEKLEEVVVVAYGNQKKESVIGSISTMDITQLKVPTSSISNNLAGQLAGVVAVTRSGEPGAGAEFYIRGISTFGANKSPLVLVDGIERDIDLVDPDDIATFSILKDATATAVYGVRGANGVVLITTRKGEDGKPRINVRAEAGLLGPTKMPSMVNSAQFAEMYNEASGTRFYTPEVIQKYRDGSDPDLFPSVNWIDELYKNFTSNQRVNVNISGGGAIAKYYVAGSLYNEGSIFKADNSNDYSSSINYNKVNFRANLDLNLTKTTVFNANLANVYEKKTSPGESTDRIWGYTFSTSPNAYPKEYSDGKASGPAVGTGYNPYNLLMNSGYTEQFWNSAQSLVGLTQDFSEIITPGLKANVKFSWDAYNSSKIIRSKEVQQFLAIGRGENNELLYQEMQKGQESLGFDTFTEGNKTTYLEASVTYDRVFDEKHRVGALFLFNQKQKNLTAKFRKDGAEQLTSTLSLPYRNQGIAGRITYAYNDRYFAEANIGYNGSENFSPGKRFGIFPAGAIGWLVSNEKFFQPITHVVDMLKVKGSYGIVGNDQIGGDRRFIYEATIQDGVDGYQFGQTGAYNPGGLRIGDWANENVGWEEARKTNIGLEVSFFQKLKIQADYFKEDREGIFLQRASLPSYIGLSKNPWVNVGKMKNQGFDGSLEYDQKVGEVVLTARGNFTYTHNEIIDNDEPDWVNLYQNRVGKPYGQLFGLQSLGLFESQEEINNSPKQTYGAVRVGDVKYKDINGDGKIDAGDETAIGYSNIPEVNYGFGATAQWKGFDLSVFFQGISKVSFFISGGAFNPFNSGNLGNSSINEDVYFNRWTEANQDRNALYPRLDSKANTNNSRISSQYLRDGSFLRLKNAELGYTLPRKLLDKTFIRTVRFYVSGVNLLTFSEFKLWDPEKGGGDGSGYPPSRIFNAGFNVNF